MAGSKGKATSSTQDTLPPAQMRSVIESLGLSRRQAATLLEVHEGSLGRYLAGSLAPPERLLDDLQALVDDHASVQEQVTQELRAHGYARVPKKAEDLPGQFEHYGPIFYRVAAARALQEYNRTHDKPGRLLWTIQREKKEKKGKN